MPVKKPDLKLIGALSGVAILWGTTYLGIRIAVETIPGWYVASIRQFIAAFILFFFLLYSKQLRWVSFKYFWRQMLLSLLMIVMANGLTTLAEETIPSGLTALVNSASPLLVFIGSALMGYQKPSLKAFIGILLGLVGIVFLFRDGVAGLLNPEYRHGIILLSMAISGWAIGTIYAKRTHTSSEGIFLDLFYQFSMAGIFQFILALIFSGDAAVSTWSGESIAATIYLAVLGSIAGYFCYNYALKKVSASDVSILTYFNTVIALFLGWLVLNEPITQDIVIASALIILGVFITNYQPKKQIT
ncbi:MAG: permease [Chitinophagaceae bacterium]|nr:MAG: permease [Chitinophagaceae bacterium]